MKDEQSTLVIRVADLELHLTQWKAKSNGKPLHLTQSEFHILRALVEGDALVSTKEHIQKQCKINGKPVSSGCLSLHITRIRKKLKMVGSEVKIYTVRGKGYTILD